MENLLQDAASRAIAYLDQIEARRVSPSERAIAGLAQLDRVLPGPSTRPAEIIRLLDEVAAPATVTNAGGRFFGFVQGGALPASVAATWMASAWDQNCALRVMSPAVAKIEDIVLAWVRRIFSLPEDAAGGIVTGATMANFTALAAARHALLARAGWDVENDGLFGAPVLKVIVGGEVHVTLLKALGMLGLGRSRPERVPVDDQGRMRADSLPQLDSMTILCLQAGNVNTGAFDPAKAICGRAREAGAWTHVDGAFGLWAAASPKYRHLVDGFELADSWCTDGHKWPNAGYDCGLAFSRDAAAMKAAMSVNAPYLATGEQREPHHYTPESSRRARAVELWAALLSLGQDGLAALIDRTCRHAARFAEGLRAAGFDVLNEVVINQVLVSFGLPEVTAAVIREIQDDGTCWCGGTQWQGRTAMRISVSSWATTDQDVEKSIAAICAIAKRRGSLGASS